MKNITAFLVTMLIFATSGFTQKLTPCEGDFFPVQVVEKKNITIHDLNAELINEGIKWDMDTIGYEDPDNGNWVEQVIPGSMNGYLYDFKSMYWQFPDGQYKKAYAFEATVKGDWLFIKEKGDSKFFYNSKTKEFIEAQPVK